MPEINPIVFPGNVRAILSTEWAGHGYREITTKNIESYAVDSAIDTDSDTWIMEIGDPNAELTAALKRDSEVRARIFGVGKQLKYIATGLSDEVGFSESNTLILSGRDMSCVATDSFAPPQVFRLAKGNKIVAREANELGIGGRLNLASTYAKSFRRDGSETYWEFWYRIYRKEQMWLWLDADGTLNGRKLNYDARPTYFLGLPPRGEGNKRRWIPVTNINFRKNIQSRLYEVWVKWNRGDKSYVEIVKDPAIKRWIRKNRKIIEDKDVHNADAARKSGLEEIFEGKVGSLELSLTVPDPGFQIEKNTVAQVHLPEQGISGVWYIVGTRVIVGPQGFIQEVRLREKEFAVSKRIPTAPSPLDLPASGEVEELLEEELTGVIPRDDWIPFFIRAAQAFRGAWVLDFFMAVLLAICDQETNFRNVRANVDGSGNPGPGRRGVEWFDFNKKSGDMDRETWNLSFGNEPGVYVSSRFAVGPMQIYSLGYKHIADDKFRPNYRDELFGGRWSPEWNIWAGAYALRDKIMNGPRKVGDTGREGDIWGPVATYYGTGTGADWYAQQVKKKVEEDYLLVVKEALAAARLSALENQTDGIPVPEIPVGGFPSPAEALSLYSGAINTDFLSELQKRQRIVAAAAWGYYNRDSISYTQGSSRLSDFDPPPNVPGATDCSGFVRWCYLSAGAPDPGTWTGNQINNGRAITPAELQPGDLVFYGNPDSQSGHVDIYVGGGQTVGHGAEEGPFLYSINRRNDRFGQRSYF